MRNSSIAGLLAVVASMDLAGSMPFNPNPPRSTRRQSEEPRYRGKPYVKWQDTKNTAEIVAWNKEVERKRAERKANSKAMRQFR